MSDINSLKKDVEWWREEIKVRQQKVTEALKKFEIRQQELTRAEQEEVRNKSHSKVT